MIGRRLGKGGRSGLICRYCAINARYMRKNVKIYKYSNVLGVQNQAFKGGERGSWRAGTRGGGKRGPDGGRGCRPKIIFSNFFRLPSTSNPTLRQSVAQAPAKCNNFVTFDCVILTKLQIIADFTQLFGGKLTPKIAILRCSNAENCNFCRFHYTLYV